MFRSISDKAVWGTTGKDWAEWVAVLDAWRMQGKGHTLTTRHLRETYSLSPWWAEVVALRYAWMKGVG